MILNFSLLLVSLSVLFLYFYWIDRFQLTPLATNFHLFGATTYLVGTLSIFDQADQMQIEWALYCFTSFLFLIAGIFFANIIFAIKLKKSTTNLQYISWENSSDSSMNSFIVFMAILSLVATIYFFILIGTVVPIEAVLNLAQGADILESGKSATESEKISTMVQVENIMAQGTFLSLLTQYSLCPQSFFIICIKQMEISLI